VIEPLFFIRMVMGMEWSADSSQLYFETNITGRFNLWKVSASGGWPMQLTVNEERTQLVSTSRDGRFLLYTQDHAGNEKPNLYLMPPNGGQGVALTATDGVGYRSIHFSPDGSRLAFSAELEGGGQYGVYVVDLPESLEALAARRPEPRLLVPSNGRMWEGCCWSRDGRRMAIGYSTDSLHNGVCIVDLDGKMHELIPDNGQYETTFVKWSPDNRRVLVNSNMAPSGQHTPGLMDVETGEIEWLTNTPWESTALDWSADGRFVAWKLNEAGSERLFLLELATGHNHPVPMDDGVFGSVEFSPDGTRLGFSYGAADRPADLWVYPLGGVPIQITHSLVGGLEPSQFVRPHIVTYQSSDGTTISAFLYLPRGARTDGSHPGLVMVRGGPTAQTQNRWSRDIQYLVSCGYVVIAPNYRGSTGFGKEFMESNRRDLGGGDLQDIIAARKFLIDHGFVKAERVGVMGGSYGGYLTLMALTKSPELWAAGVSVVPFANWFTEYENEDETLQAFDRMMMGDPVENRDFWIDRSPYFFVDRIKAPLLMLAGANDIRCPASETLDIEAKIREAGGTVEARIYENEGHGFMKRENSIDAFTRTVSFFARHLPPTP
jgi:dipeptidyl aminopeptidase/acylaminoacyl peptidase